MKIDIETKYNIGDELFIYFPEGAAFTLTAEKVVDIKINFGKGKPIVKYKFKNERIGLKDENEVFDNKAMKEHFEKIFDNDQGPISSLYSLEGAKQ